MSTGRFGGSGSSFFWAGFNFQWIPFSFQTQKAGEAREVKVVMQPRSFPVEKGTMTSGWSSNISFIKTRRQYHDKRLTKKENRRLFSSGNIFPLYSHLALTSVISNVFTPTVCLLRSAWWVGGLGAPCLVWFHTGKRSSEPKSVNKTSAVHWSRIYSVFPSGPADFVGFLQSFGPYGGQR